MFVRGVTQRKVFYTSRLRRLIFLINDLGLSSQFSEGIGPDKFTLTKTGFLDEVQIRNLIQSEKSLNQS